MAVGTGQRGDDRLRRAAGGGDCRGAGGAHDRTRSHNRRARRRPGGCAGGRGPSAAGVIARRCPNRAARRPRGGDGAAAGSPAGVARRGRGDHNGAPVSERGQVSVMACALVLLLVVAGFLLGTLGGIDSAGANAQRAADMAALAAGRELSGDPALTAGGLRAGADDAARENGGRLLSLTRLTDEGLPSGVEVSVAVDGEHTVRAQARVRVEFTATEPTGSFRPVDLHGLVGRAAVVAAAAAQVGWPYVWGGESRAEGGFDCSGLVDYAFQAASVPLPGRPTAAALWSLAQPIAPSALEPGDLVFLGAPSGAPYHVGIYVGEGTVLSAPHTGAQVGYSPLASGGWDGYGRLLPPEPGLRADPVEHAARAAGVPAHVVAAELSLGLAGDAQSAAQALAASMRAHPGSLEQAIAAQLGDASRAALVLRWASGPALPMAAAVRLVPVPVSAPDAGVGDVRSPSGPTAARGRRSPAGGSLLDHL